MFAKKPLAKKLASINIEDDPAINNSKYFEYDALDWKDLFVIFLIFVLYSYKAFLS